MYSIKLLSRSVTLPIMILAISVAMGCSSDDGRPVKIKGQMVYSAERALSKTDTARVSMFEDRDDGGDKRIVAERSLHDLGRKTIAFEIDVARNLIDPAGTYGIRAEILDQEGNVTWQTRSATTIKPLEQHDSVSLRLKPLLDDSRFDFEKYACDDGFYLNAAYGQGEAIVRLGNRRLVLNARADGSYADDHGNRFDIDADHVSLVIDGAAHGGCNPIAEAERNAAENSDARSDSRSNKDQSSQTGNETSSEVR